MDAGRYGEGVKVKVINGPLPPMSEATAGALRSDPRVLDAYLGKARVS